MAGIIFKPYPNNPGKGAVMLIDTGRLGKKGAPTIQGPDGQTYTGKYLNTENGIDQYEFPSEIRGMQNLQLNYGGESTNLASGSQAYEGESVGAFQPRARGSAGYGGPGIFAPGQYGNYGFYPGYLGGQFPNPELIKAAPYKFVDPMEYAKKFGAFNRSEFQANDALAKGMALDQIDTELQGLQHFAPAAAALQREQVSLDNQFNQAQRTAQVRQAMPGSIEALSAQQKRAATYAGGGLPDTLQDRALELGVRSEAADRAAAGGFGASSSVARKASDLMSAQQRLQIAQYGEQLTGQNIQSQMALQLAPTEYANAGSQIRVMPTLSGSQLQQANRGELNQYTMMNPATALSQAIQQRQFRTSQLQGVNTANTGIQNEFALGKFNYDVSYANAVAGAGQLDVNAQAEYDQQARAEQIAKDQMEAAQRANTINDVIKGAGVALPIATKIINSLTGGSSDTEIPTTEDILGEGSLVEGNIPDFNIGASETDITGESSGFDFPNLETGQGSMPEFGIGDTGSDISLGSDTGEFQLYASKVPAAVARSLVMSPTTKQLTSDLNLDSAATLSLAAMPSSQVDNIATGTLANAGISTQPVPGFVPAGMDFQGRPVYADPKLASDQTFTPGVQAVAGISQTLSGLNIPALPKDRLDSVATKASDSKLVSELDSHIKNGDTKAFVNTIQKSFGQPAVDKIRPKKGTDSAVAAYAASQHWSGMSKGQKSLVLSTIGTQSLRGTDGRKLTQIPIPATAKDKVRPLTVGGALSITRAGYNNKEAAYHWGDLSNLQRVLGGGKHVLNLAKNGEDAGVLTRTSGVPQIDPAQGLGMSASLLAKGWGNVI